MLPIRFGYASKLCAPAQVSPTLPVPLRQPVAASLPDLPSSLNFLRLSTRTRTADSAPAAPMEYSSKPPRFVCAIRPGFPTAASWNSPDRARRYDLPALAAAVQSRRTARRHTPAKSGETSYFGILA